MIEVNNLQNNIFTNTMNIIYSLSFYSPIIICVSIVVFSMFTVTMNKAFVYFVWVFIITFIRILILLFFKVNQNDQIEQIPIICYIALDILIKYILSCFPSSFWNISGNILSGMFLGGLASLIMYGTKLKSYLYINEINTNKEVCSMPSKQQFKCSVYKDGTLVREL